MIELKPVLDRLYAEFNIPDSATDPIHIVRRFERPDDREVVGFIAASLAFGRVLSVIQSIERVLAIMAAAGGMRARVRAGARENVVRAGRPPLDARTDLVALVWVMKQMIDRAGSIEGFLAESHDPAADDIGAALDSFSKRALALDLRAYADTCPNVPASATSSRGRRPARRASGSICSCAGWCAATRSTSKVWTRVSPAKLIVPLDTHVIRVGRCLQLTLHQPGLADGARHHGDRCASSIPAIR